LGYAHDFLDNPSGALQSLTEVIIAEGQVELGNIWPELLTAKK
jgi:hypothetical protein